MMRPGTFAPKLIVKRTNGEIWDLSKIKPEKFTLVTFYRGIHCPKCKAYLQKLNELLNNFKEEGVSQVIAISGDTQAKALRAKSDWEITNLKIGYDLDPVSMSNWGLFISESIKDEEPALFSEPGIFLIDDATKLFYCATGSLPFARPDLEDLLEGLKYINENGYPRRGTVQYQNVNKPKNKTDERNSGNSDISKEDIVDWNSEIEMVDNHVASDLKNEKEMPDLDDHDKSHAS